MLFLHGLTIMKQKSDNKINKMLKIKEKENKHDEVRGPIGSYITK